MSIKKCIIPAAGLGTRFLPATKAQPKEMLPIVDKPSIQYIVEEAVASGIEEILIITGRGKRAIEDHFDRSWELEHELQKKEKHELTEEMKHISNLANIYYIRQKEALGLGHAIYQGRHFIGNDPFAVMLGDDVVKSSTPCTWQLISQYNKYNNPIIGIQHVSDDQLSSYGIINAQRISYSSHLIHSLIEKPSKKDAPSNLAVMGRYILTPEIFPILEKIQPGKNNEIQLTDALSVLGEKRQIIGYEFEGERYDIGSKFGYLKAMIDFALERADLHEELQKYINNLAEEKTCTKSVS